MGECIFQVSKVQPYRLEKCPFFFFFFLALDLIKIPTIGKSRKGQPVECGWNWSDVSHFQVWCIKTPYLILHTLVSLVHWPNENDEPRIMKWKNAQYLKNHTESFPLTKVRCGLTKINSSMDLSHWDLGVCYIS